MAELTAPKIDYYIDILKRGFVIGEEMKPYVDELFNELHKIAPCGNDNRRELWLFADVSGTTDDGFLCSCSYSDWRSDDEKCAIEPCDHRYTPV